MSISYVAIAWTSFKRGTTIEGPYGQDYLDHDETGDPVAAAYGPNHRRLQQLKAKYDPDNFFHMNQNIRPLS